MAAAQGGATRPISDAEFARVQRFIYEAAGISLGSTKHALVSTRLASRLAQHGMHGFDDYLELLGSGEHPDEVRRAVDLLTTNETYFFRESRHLDFLRVQALSARGGTGMLRVWSAACSSGEEVYSIAMVLADVLGEAPWEVVGTDISTRMLEDAGRAVYPVERARHVPPEYLRRFCLRGTEEHEGRLLIDRRLRSRVSFGQVNLNAPLPSMGRFDLVFLRNVMIYFSEDTRRQVVGRVIQTLRPAGHLCVGHAESLINLTDAVRVVAPAIYRKST